MTDWTYKLLRYAQGRCDDTEAAQVFAELRRSPELLERYRALQRVRSRFGEHWDAFADPVEAEGRWAIAIRGAFDAARQLGVAISERAASIGSATQVQLVPAYRGVADPLATQEVQDALSEAAASADSRDYEESLDSVARAAASVPQLQEEVRWAIEFGGRAVGELILLPTEGRAVVRVPDSEPGRWSLVLMGVEEERRVALERIEGTGHRIAEVDMSTGVFHWLLLREEEAE